ncbi:hypothetical protein AB0F46_38655 [Streptomyces sp. NPDC026665]|uniref:hypothetical protein n=1 Tax=Streptomyces sp. NPDC026665 TaxID=3154798 RepID=UPI0033C25028
MAMAYCRDLVRSDLTSFDVLDIQDDVRREQMRRKVMLASIRYRYASDLPEFIGNRIVGKIWRIPLILGLGVLLALRWGDEWFGAQVLLYVLGVTALVAAFFLLYVGLQRVYEQGRVGASFTLLATTTLGISSLVATAIRPSIISVRPLAWSFVAGWDAACVMLLSMQATLTVAAVIGRRAMNERCFPLDNLALTTLAVAAMIHNDRNRWRSASVTRKWCLEIESIAIHAESALTRSKASPMQSRRLRRDLQEEAWRIGAAYRRHQQTLVVASSEVDVSRVIESLACGMEALLDGDRQALLENAPDAVTRSSLLAQAFNRVKSGLLIIAAGVALPYVPGVMGDTGSSLRVLLLTLGVLQLVTVQADVVSRIGGALDKSLPWK